MSDFNLHPPVGAKHKKKIVGRGQGSGHGTTAGRGNKGQQSRSGGKTYPGFEGGQMPLFRRVAKRGFSNQMFSQDYQIVNLVDIEARYVSGETVNGASLVGKGLVKKTDAPIKVLAVGEITKALTFDVDKLSATALAKIEKAGGTVQTH